MLPQRKIERRTIQDLDKALTSLSSHFGETEFVIIGSQASLVDWPYIPDEMRNTPEIDVYLAHWKRWEDDNPGISADFEIEGLFGQGSAFHQSYGFYIDGVSPSTAALPDDWQKQAVYREIVQDGKTITAIAPCLEHLVVAKLRRCDPKDQIFTEAAARTRGLDLDKVREGLETAPYESHERQRALQFLNTLHAKRPQVLGKILPPEYPLDGSHHPFWTQYGLTVTIREYDEAAKLYTKVSNPLGPAVKSTAAEAYAIHGVKMSKSRWEVHPDVAGYDAPSPFRY